MQTISVPDMMCENCANAIRGKLERVKGVESIAFDIPAKTVTVTGPAKRAVVVKSIKQAGYSPE